MGTSLRLVLTLRITGIDKELANTANFRRSPKERTTGMSDGVAKPWAKAVPLEVPVKRSLLEDSSLASLTITPLVKTEATDKPGRNKIIS